MAHPGWAEADTIEKSVTGWTIYTFAINVGVEHIARIKGNGVNRKRNLKVEGQTTDVDVCGCRSPRL